MEPTLSEWPDGVIESNLSTLPGQPEHSALRAYTPKFETTREAIRVDETETPLILGD